MEKSSGITQTPLVRIRGLTKTFPGVRANDGIDLDIRAGTVHALLGENGAGKTTLMCVLTGLYRADGGDIFWQGEKVHINSAAKAAELGMGIVHQRFSLIPTFSVAENIALGTRTNRPFRTDLGKLGQRIKALARDYGFEIDPDKQIDQLSMGARQRVEIVKILYRDANLLILDEPSSVLTPQEVSELFRVIRRLVAGGRAVVFITHKLDEVLEVADIITVLRDGRVVGELPKEEATTKALAKLMVGRDVSFERKKTPLRAGVPVLRVKNLHVEDSEGRDVLNSVSLEVRAGEIVGIAGVAGNGQHWLTEAIAGLFKSTSGSVHVGASDITNADPQQVLNSGLSYTPADRRGTGLVLDMNVRDNILIRDYRSSRFSRFGMLRYKKVEQHTGNLIKEYGIRAINQFVRVGTLSGGNQQKVVVAREFSRQPEVLLVEQPTMGLDVGATEYVHSILLAQRERGAAILLVSTELNEVLALSDRVLVMFKGDIIGEVDPQTTPLEQIGLLMAGNRSRVTDQIEVEV